jgi:hypothetical protein
MIVKSTIVSDIHSPSGHRNEIFPEMIEKLKQSLLEDIKAMMNELLNEKKER